MSLSRVGGSSAAATSIAIPAHVAGDLIVIWAYRDGNTTPPTKPTASGTVPAWVTVDGPTGANANSAICAYFLATGTTETSGTWTNATGMSVEVWRGADVNPLGGHAQSGGSVGSGGNLAVPAITPTDPTGNSIFLLFAGWQTVTAWSTAPAGYTQRSNVATECEALTKDTTTTDGAVNVSGTASGAGGYRTQQLEILATFGNRVSQDATEVLYATSAALARASQLALEVLYATSAAKARTSQVAVEVLMKGAPSVSDRISQVAIEVLMTRPFVSAPFISSVTQVFAPSVVPDIAVPFIASVTILHAPVVSSAELDVPFIGSVSVVYTPTLTAAGAEVDVPFIASVTVVYGLGLPTQVSSGVMVLAAGDAEITPQTITLATLVLEGDDPMTFGAIQATSGVMRLAADSPGSGVIQPTSGVLNLRADSPNTIGLMVPSARLLMAGDPPVVFPVRPQSGVLLLRSDGVGVAPAAPVGGRLLLAAGSPNVYPIQISGSGILRLRADNPTVANAGYIFDTSGILRLRSDVPIITPLTEPVNPPPVSGTGLHVSVTV